MHRKSQTTKLTSAKSLDEAVKILDGRKASGIYKKHVNLAFNLKNDPNNKIRHQMLSECEDELAKEEKKKMDEMIHTEQSTEGTGGKEGSAGQTGQADGRELDSLIETPESGEGSKPAQAQTGESQLDSALEEAVGDEHEAPVDPMNKAIIDYMDDDMSQVEAHNAASKDKEFSEAIADMRILKKVIPLLRAANKDIKALRETIKVTDGKVELGRIPGETGLSEGIKPGENGWPQETKTTTDGAKYDSDPTKVAETQKHILNKYMD